MGSMRMTKVAVVALALAGCTDDPVGQTSLGSGGPTSVTGDGSSGASASETGAPGSDDGVDATGTTGAADDCACAPGTDVVHVMSDDGELWSYDPTTNAFDSIGPIACGGFDPFSMAVDRSGKAWVLLLDNIAHSTVAKGLFKIDIADASGCEPVPYEEGLFGVYGTSFVTNGPPDNCEKLYTQSYSGSGPFAEGPGLGFVGVLEDGVMNTVGPVNYDGGELAGTGDGRLFAFTGVGPVKLVELDKDTAAEIEVLPLTGLDKTDASAMAFYGGDFYLFTESANPTCQPCLDMACADELAACEAEGDACQSTLACLLAGGGEASGCEGDLAGAAGPLRDCMWASCGPECDKAGVVSKVVHVDWDDSDGMGRAVTTVEPFAPVRIVGAGSSTCVPVFVP